MINNIIILSTLFYCFSKINKNKQLLYIHSFEKYCEYKPSTNHFTNITKHMKICVDEYTAKSIIITENNNN
jgi:hypothetical protein